MNNKTLRRLSPCVSLLLTACSSGGLLATVGPDYQAAPMLTEAKWQTQHLDQSSLPIAHQGDPANLARWWDRFQDPVLSRFLNAAQHESNSVSDARVRIEQARSSLVSANAALLPSLDSQVNFKRSSSSFGSAPFVWNQLPFGLQSSWEVDLFGGLSRQDEAAHSHMESSEFAWHDARIAVAAEVANAYLAYRYCEAQAHIIRSDTESRRESARLSEISGQAGFLAAGNVAIANASAAEGNKTLLQQQAQCDRAIKGLVAMTALPETEVRRLLTEKPDQIGKLPVPPALKIDSLPAKVLLQRPDIAAAERNIAEASANIGVAQAKRFPKLSLSGNITPTLQNINGGAFLLAQTWAIGPTLSLPLFDAGKRAADVEVARVQYQAAESTFKNKVRTAVKEVEDALVRLDSAAKRLPEGRKALSGYQTNFQSEQNLYRSGLGNLINVEVSRRNMLSAEMALKEIEQEWVSANIALYRAAGGNLEVSESQASVGKTH